MTIARDTGKMYGFDREIIRIFRSLCNIKRNIFKPCNAIKFFTNVTRYVNLYFIHIIFYTNNTLGIIVEPKSLLKLKEFQHNHKLF